MLTPTEHKIPSLALPELVHDMYCNAILNINEPVTLCMLCRVWPQFLPNWHAEQRIGSLCMLVSTLAPCLYLWRSHCHQGGLIAAVR